MKFWMIGLIIIILFFVFLYTTPNGGESDEVKVYKNDSVLWVCSFSDLKMELFFLKKNMYRVIGIS